jgi:hypothetical protein
MNRKNILSIDVAKTCEEILKPHLPMALRLSSILLAGSALALNRQYQLLLDDCRLFLSSLNHSRYAMEEVTLKPGTKRYVYLHPLTTPSSLQKEYRAGGRVHPPSRVAPPVGRHQLPQGNLHLHLRSVRIDHTVERVGKPISSQTYQPKKQGRSVHAIV